LTNAHKVIFPGVGEASSAMKYLEERGLDKTIISLRKPVLGICLGMQLMCRFTEEGQTKCLGIFDADVRLFPPVEKIPHMGWNNLKFNKEDPILKYIKEDEYVYFVHSYYAESDNSELVAYSEYEKKVPAIVRKDNVYGIQFHPEKSGETGLNILKAYKEIIEK